MGSVLTRSTWHRTMQTAGAPVLHEDLTKLGVSHMLDCEAVENTVKPKLKFRLQEPAAEG